MNRNSNINKICNNHIVIFFYCSRRIFESFIHFTSSNSFLPIFCFFFQKMNLLSFISDFLPFVLNPIQSLPFQITFLLIFSFSNIRSILIFFARLSFPFNIPEAKNLREKTKHRQVKRCNRRRGRSFSYF